MSQSATAGSRLGDAIDALRVAAVSARSRHAVGGVVAAAAFALGSATATATDTVPVGNSTTPMTVSAGTYGDEFCDTWIAIERAFATPPEGEAEMAAWYAETAAPLVAMVREHAPDAFAEQVNALMDAAEEFGTTGDYSVLFTSEFSDAAAAIYPTFEDGWGFPVVAASLTDYAFGGIPERLAPGPTAFVVHNESEAGEAHEMLLIRVNDGVDLTVDELLALPEEELERDATLVNSAFTPATGTTAGVVVDLTPGRYVYACFVAEGSIDGAEGTGPPHFTMGMFGEFTVD
jgi:hypothetical protein